jgi:REP element-mobilizing transposase RayT
MESEADHCHILFEAKPQIQLSKLINNFKTVSSRLIRKRFKSHIDINGIYTMLKKQYLCSKLE